MGTNTMQQGGLDYENIVNLFANVEKSNIDHIRTNPQEGFFSFDVVCNAYEKGRKVSNEEFKAINITPDEFHGEWNYTIHPIIKI